VQHLLPQILPFHMYVLATCWVPLFTVAMVYEISHSILSYVLLGRTWRHKCPQ